jgi:uncharacterized protein involved in type VI secretion and phage assembly
MSRRPGVVTAFIRAVDPQNGRVQVEYRAMEDDLLSTWAPVATPMSGGQRGQLFMPEVGDECLVAFENGEFEHPFVVGYLWNGQQVSPETEAFNRVIVTPGGHQLRFEDKDSDTRIILRSNGQHELKLEDTASGPYAQLKSNGGRYLRLDDTPAGGKIEIRSGSHQITLDDAPAGTSIRLDSGMGMVTIAMNATPVPSLSISVAGNTVDISAAAMNITAAGSVAVSAGSAANVTVGGSATITAGGTASITAGGAVNLTAATTNVTTGALTVNAAASTFTGVLTATTVVASTVVAGIYSPGIGNLL